MSRQTEATTDAALAKTKQMRQYAREGRNRNIPVLGQADGPPEPRSQRGGDHKGFGRGNSAGPSLPRSGRRTGSSTPGCSSSGETLALERSQRCDEDPHTAAAEGQSVVAPLVLDLAVLSEGTQGQCGTRGLDVGVQAKHLTLYLGNTAEILQCQKNTRHFDFLSKSDTHVG